eukprot:TRINITY_DN59696_c0_g1_i1.p1 TRINITY_DN59696_c0_g1~~TRINITY_DN59696_c0_g1_i1.p1  ORF type:complete len:435 (+),score=40.49 TRINITY_DN59696_c0_g1_i1:145-1449(+)
MASCNPATWRSAKQNLSIDVSFPNFRAAWRDLANAPVDDDSGQWIRSEPFTVMQDWSFIVELGMQEGKCGLYLSSYKTGLLPLTVSGCEISLDQECAWDDDVMYKPHWCDFVECEKEGFPTGDISTGWKLSEREVLEQAAAHGDELKMVLTLTLRVHRCPDFTSCLRLPADGVMRLWSEPCTVTLRGADAASVSIPKAMLLHFSKVLAAGLQSDMSESRSHVFDTLDAPKGALEDMRTCFIHGGFASSVCTSLDRLLELLVLADRYAIAPLVTSATFYCCVGLHRGNVAKVLLKADKHQLLPLMHAALRFATWDRETLSAVQDAEEYNAFSADLLRLVSAYAELIEPRIDNDRPLPVNLQWGDVPHEFPGTTDWRKLSQPQLRRACLERCVATSGSAIEMAARLSKHGVTSDPPGELPSKRRRTATADSRTTYR